MNKQLNKNLKRTVLGAILIGAILVFVQGIKTHTNKEENNYAKTKIAQSANSNPAKAKSVTASEENKITNLNNFLFVGDSYTVLLEDTIKANNDKVYICAKEGIRPSEWLDKVSDFPNNSKIDGIVLLIGVNGIEYPSNKNNVKTLINKLSDKYQGKTIYVQRVFPVGKKFKNYNPITFNEDISDLNSFVKSYCKTMSNVKFIDATSGFVSSDGYLLHTKDGLHVSMSYNKQFYDNILEAINEIEK